MARRSFWNPMTNVGAFRERGLTIVRGEGSTVWDDAGNALLDVSAALWYSATSATDAGRARRRRRAADARALVVQDVRRLHLAEDRGARSAYRRARSARQREDLLHLRRRRVDRHGGEARARLLGRQSASRTSVSSSRASSPTTARTRTARRSAGCRRSVEGYGRLVPEVEQVAVGRRRGARGGDRPDRRRPASSRSSPSRSSAPAA